MKRIHKIQFDKRRGTYSVNIRRDGVRRYFALGSTRTEAEKTLEKLELDMANGKLVFVEQETTQTLTHDGKKDMSLQELALQNLEWMQANRAIGTFRNRRHFALQFLDFIGEVNVSEISRMRLEQYYAWAKEHHSRSANGGNQALAHIKAMLKWGEEMELVDLPFKRFPKLNYTPPPTKRIDDVTLRMLLGNADPDLRDLMTFGILTGLRPSELRSLMQSNIGHTADGTPYVLIERHKTAKTARTFMPRSVPLSPEAEAIVERQIKAHPQAKTIFINVDGNPYTRYALRNKLRRLCQRIGLENAVTPYALRHTFASRQSDEGTESNNLASMMGHSTTRTLTRYVKNTLESQRRSVETLENGLKSLLHPVPENGAELEAVVGK